VKDILVNALIRAMRTFFQTFIGIYLAGLAVDPTLNDLADTKLLASAVAGAIVAVLAFLQNVVEEIVPVNYNRG